MKKSYAVLSPSVGRLAVAVAGPPRKQAGARSLARKIIASSPALFNASQENFQSSSAIDVPPRRIHLDLWSSRTTRGVVIPRAA